MYGQTCRKITHIFDKKLAQGNGAFKRKTQDKFKIKIITSSLVSGFITEVSQGKKF